jgi:ornithine cyclodeaminase
MTIDIIGPDAEALISWDGLVQALVEGHHLPRAEIGDTLLYRGTDTLLNRAAWIDGLGQLVKTATIFPGNSDLGKPSVNGAVTIYDDKTGELGALVDFHLVTKWKTAGDSLLAARRLARQDSRNFLIIGAGTVARSMAEAYRSAFPEARIAFWNRSPGGAQRAADAVGMGAVAVTDLPRAAAEADVICTATMSHDPVIQGNWLRPGTHVDLIGAYRPDMREADDEALQRGRIFVDSRATTIHHIGELMDPIARGVISESDVVADFYDIPKGNFVRRSPDEVTLAKNGGGAHLDLMTAAYILQAWRSR